MVNFTDFINGRTAIEPLDPADKAAIAETVKALPFYDFIEDKKTFEMWFDPAKPGALKDFTFTTAIDALVGSGREVQAHYAKHVGSTYGWHECLRLTAISAKELGYPADAKVLDFLTEYTGRIIHESWSLGGWKPEVNHLHAAMRAVSSPKKVLVHGTTDVPKDDGTVVTNVFHAWYLDEERADAESHLHPENAEYLQGAEAIQLVLAFFLKEKRSLAECEWLVKVATVVACASDLERGKPTEKARGYTQALFGPDETVGAFAPLYLLLRRVSKGIEVSPFLEGNTEAAAAHELVDEEDIKFFLGRTLDARVQLAALNAWRGIAKLKAWRTAHTDTHR